MESLFNYIAANYSEFEYWKQLSDSDKVNFLFDLYSAECIKLASDTSLDLSNFFNVVHNELNGNDNDTYIDNFGDDEDRVDVMIDEDNIMIESNSLKAVRYVTNKLVESGYIIKRDLSIEKLFRRDKVTKYLRIFKIINIAPDICIN